MADVAQLGDDEVAAFLSRHQKIDSCASLSAGTQVGSWRIAAFIGRGGSSEVYRALPWCDDPIAPTAGRIAALKIAILPSDNERIGREAKILAGLPRGAFPILYGTGETEGRAWIAMEMLEPSDMLPSRSRNIAAYLIAVAKAVRILHLRGLVHRDIKPQNIMFRGGSPVLVDFGLAEREGARISESAGTRRYAAPEQYDGGEITRATDIHALGVLADECFGGDPPRDWAMIIDRATSSIPAHRFADITEFINAVRRRSLARYFRYALLGLALAAIAFIGALVWWTNGGEETFRFRSLCKTANGIREEKKIVEQKFEKRKIGNAEIEVPLWTKYLTITNKVEETLIELNGTTQTFKRPIKLNDGFYRIVGPGTISANFAGSSNVVLRLENCNFQNQAVDLPPGNSITIDVGDKAYLNFAAFDESDRYDSDSAVNRYIKQNVNNSANIGSYIRVGGPATTSELIEELHRLNLEFFRSEK